MEVLLAHISACSAFFRSHIFEIFQCGISERVVQNALLKGKVEKWNKMLEDRPEIKAVVFVLHLVCKLPVEID